MKRINMLERRLPTSDIIALWNDIEFLTESDIRYILKQAKHTKYDYHFITSMIQLNAGLNRSKGMTRREI